MSIKLKGYDKAATPDPVCNGTCANRVQTTTNDKPDGFGVCTPAQFDEVYLELIKRDLETAQSYQNIRLFKHLPEADLRGLYDDTWQHFHCGYLPDWILTKSRAQFQCGTYVNKKTGKIKRLPPPSRRIIAPTLSMNHFNAIALESDRKRMDKNFWKQHAGEKELFYDATVANTDTVIVVEGEVDAMSIWQACIGFTRNNKFSPVAILGCNNWKKTLLPNLNGLLRGKKILLLLDGDDGRTAAVELQKALIQRQVPAVTRFFFDFLNDDDKQFFDEKVDANDILVKRGDNFLNNLVCKIFNDAQADFANVQNEINSQNIFADKPKPKKTAPFQATQADRDEINLILKDFVHASNLSRDQWWSVGAILFRYGFTVDDFKDWSNDGDSRYNAQVCQNEWQSYAAEIPKLKDDEGYKIGTLIQLAKQYGYVPTRRNPHVTGDDEIAQWQKVNGAIHPETLTELKNAAKQIAAYSVPTAATANDIAVQRLLGAMKYYTPFGKVASQFLIKLQDAKKSARKKVSLFDKDNSSPEPTDEDKELALLDLTAINKNITSYFNQAKKAHERYAAQVRRKESVEQQAQQQHRDVFTPETTQSLIPNCPVDLELPQNSTFGEDGITVTEVDRNGDEVVIEACKNPVVPTKIFREPSTNLTKYEVAIMTAGKWFSTIVDGKTLQDGRSVSALGNFGAHITDQKSTAKFFAKIIAANEANGRLQHVRMFNKPGWHGGEFVYPATENADYIVIRSGIDYRTIFTSSGNEDKWMLKFFQLTDPRNVTNHGALKRIVIGASLLAPLLPKFKMLNPQFNIWGTSNFSKTPLIKFALSIYGDPTDGQLMRTWSSSPKNILTMSAGFNCFPLFVDEGETMSRKTQDEISEYIYNFSTGIIGQNNKRNGDVRPTEKFFSVRLSTAERPMHNAADKRGAYKRLIDLHVTKPLFSDKDGHKLHIFCGENFGLFGRQWVQYIADHEAEITETFHKLCDYFDDVGFIRNGERVPISTVDATNARATIACATAIFEFYHCLGFTNGEYLYDDVKADIAEILAELPSVDEISDVTRCVELFKSWVAENYKRFVRPQELNGVPFDSDDATSESYAPEAGRIFSRGTVAIFPGAFELACRDANIPNSKKFLEDLYDADLLECSDRQHKSRSLKNKAKIPVRAYYIKIGDFDAQSDDVFAEYEESSYDNA